ncbi:HAD family phosphatase [Conexibacter sp. SYSU D00693]|uniref:HAD family hydrolase n=1 Tax=Conexibacter sp. SYSU D00693 TaxID=2812560 RepID=UPI00196ADCBD|nr:HAD family phosphatase [Conexibacter sp. SYSU D00693]
MTTETRALLLDADGNLFPSEEPAFVASTEVTNRFLEAHGVQRRYEPEELRLATTGKNFRTTAVDLLAEAGMADRLSAEALERWVAEERRAVSIYLGEVLRPDPAVLEPLTRLAAGHTLAAVSSSATPRLAACFAATGLDELLPPEVRFSAEDSLPVPTSKPDPAVYLHALERLGLDAAQALAVEDSVPGAQSAVAAGIPTIGNLCFVQLPERDERRVALLEAGVATVVTSWDEVEDAVASPVP